MACLLFFENKNTADGLVRRTECRKTDEKRLFYAYLRE